MRTNKQSKLLGVQALNHRAASIANTVYNQIRINAGLSFSTYGN